MEHEGKPTPHANIRQIKYEHRSAVWQDAERRGAYDVHIKARTSIAME
jgi:hypothetical protein